MTLAFLLVATLELSSPPSTARRDNPHLEAAAEAYRNQQWEDAAAGFADAYALEPRPEYLYARGQSLRHGGDCSAAITAYEEFLTLSPPEEAAADANAHITACREQLEARADTVRPPAPIVSTPLPPSRPVHPSTVPPPQHWVRDRLGLGLSISGLVLAGVGGTVLTLAHRQQAQAQGADNEQAYRDAFGSAPVMSQVGIGLLCTGGVALLSGLVRYAIVARSR